MTRQSVTLDDDLAKEAREILGVKTTSEAVRIALSEVLRRHRRDKALEYIGTLDLGLTPDCPKHFREERWSNYRAAK